VSVSFTGSTCARNPATLSLSPATATALPGASVVYQATVANNDTAACGSSSFALSQALPGGLGGSLSASSLAINAGASASVSWTVSSSIGTTDGTYTLDLSATPAGGTTGTTAHASLVVAGDKVAPTLSITSPAPGVVLSGGKATLSADASDASGISVVEFHVDGALLASDTRSPYTASWNLRRVAKGAHTITVRAVDGAGNATTQQVSVTVP
jgi:hypothetical protein